MTNFFSSYNLEMDIAHLDDKMELGHSPYPPIDDIEFDLEPDQQQSVDRSMMDDAEVTENNTDPMQADAVNIYNDDDMFEDEELQPWYYNELEDLNMDSYEGENNQQDKEVLPDEAAGSVNMAGEQGTGLVEETTKQIGSHDFEPGAEIEVEAQEIQVTPDYSNTNTIPDTIDSTFSSEVEHVDNANPKPNIEAKIDEATDTQVTDFATQDAIAVKNKNASPSDVVETAIDERNTESIAQTSEYHKPDTVTERSQTSPRNSTAIDNAAEETAQPNQDSNNVEISRLEEDGMNNSQESLHPITVVYLGQEMSFFPPMVENPSATFFLSDSTLAYEPVEKLLLSCRDILGATLEHDDELVLDIPALGLHICEDSKYSSQITLSQVVDVYLNLSQNEKFEDIDPLYCSLSSRVCLASQYAYLAACAAEGKTYSEIAADYVDSPEHDSHSVHEDREPDQIEETHVDESKSGEANVNIATLNEISGDSNDAVYVAENESNLSNVHEAGDAQYLVAVDTAVEPYEQDEAQAGTAVTAELSQDSPRDTNDESFNHTVSQLSGYQHESDDGTHTTKPDNADNARGDIETTQPDESGSVSSHTMDGEATVDLAEHITSSFDHTEEFRDPRSPANQQQESHEDIDAFDLGEDLFKDEEIEEPEPLTDDPTKDTKAAEEAAVSDPATSATQTEAFVNTNDDAAYDGLRLDEIEPELADDDATNDDVDEFDFLQTENVVVDAPVTPSKQNGTKRKVLEDEDELDFLDFSTPEPKRTRPS